MFELSLVTNTLSLMLVQTDKNNYTVSVYKDGAIIAPMYFDSRIKALQYFFELAEANKLFEVTI